MRRKGKKGLKLSLAVLISVVGMFGAYKGDIENIINRKSKDEVIVVNDAALNNDDYKLNETLIDTSFVGDKYPENYTWIGNGKTELTEDEENMLREKGNNSFWVQYTPLDSLGRGQKITALITFEGIVNRSKELLKIKYPEKSSEEIKKIVEKRPSFSSSTHVAGEYLDGEYQQKKETWEGTIKNNKKVQMKSLKGDFYNKSHSLAWSLGGDMETHNLTLGTRGQNVGTNSSEGGGMGFSETTVRNAFKANQELKIFYSVSPVYKDDELVPRGSVVRTFSVNDDGKTMNQYLWVFNTQSGAEVNYLTGEFTLEGGG